MLAKTKCIEFEGIEPKFIDVEISIANGLPAINFVGLPSKAVLESKERLRSVLDTLNINLPAKRITINLSPANIKKEGSHYDLAIIMSLLACLGHIDSEGIQNYIFMGEVSLDGSLKPAKGLIPTAMIASQNNINIAFPQSQQNEIFWAKKIKLVPLNSIAEAIDHFSGKRVKTLNINPQHNIKRKNIHNPVLLENIKGQERAKRAMIIAASGGHHSLLVGPPGSGKSMLASALWGLLPKPTPEEIIEINAIHTMYGNLHSGELLLNRPFEAPHSSSSANALVGGGSTPKAGCVTLAHRGLLFLDEFAEFKTNVIDSLRQPLENKTVNIVRSNKKISFPCDFQMIVAMNPCKCGHLNQPKQCKDAPDCAQKYLQKISGPILDRIDIFAETVAINSRAKTSITTEQAKEQVSKAYSAQKERYKDINILNNHQAENSHIDTLFILEPKAKLLLDKMVDKQNISARSYYKIIRIAQTIADIEGMPAIRENCIAEAISYKIPSF